MKKHILITSLSGSYGGMEIRMFQDAELLVHEGYQVSLLVNPFPGLDKLKANLPEQVKVYVFPIPYFLENWRFRHIKKIIAYAFYKIFFKIVKPDLVHVFMCWTTYGLTHLWGASLNNVKTIVSVHNVFKPETLGIFIEKHLTTCFKALVTSYGVSKSAQQNFQQIYNDYLPNKVQEINNWVDLTKFYPSEEKKLTLKKQLNLPVGATIIGCIARLSPQKNLFYLIDVFREILKLKPKSFLLLVGSGELENEIRQYLKEKDLEKNSKVIGFVTNVEDYYRIIDVHTLLSLREGFGISTIEAMASGCVCCVSDIPGSRDVIYSPSLGLKVELDNVVDTSATLFALMQNQKMMEELAKNSQDEVAQRYEEGAIKQQMLTLYKKAIDAELTTL